jgi:Na+/melibiose symporter-like transporter
MDKKEAKKIAKEQRALEIAERNKKFRRANVWQMILMPFGSVAHNSFMFLMGFVSYYAAGPVGLGTVIASYVLTGTRIFDGITDPIVALVVDKTKGRFGKVRPFIVLCWAMMSTATILMFFTNHLVPEGFRLIYFILLYMVFIIGYTFSGVAFNTGFAIMTNDPQQRPVIGGLQMIFSMLFFTAAYMFQSMYLVPKYGGFSEVALFQDMTIIVVIFAAFGYGLHMASVWQRDRIENFGTGDTSVKIKFKDLWPVLKNNRPLQMSILSSVTDKIAMQISGNAVVMVMLFGIIIGDYKMSGVMQGIATLPTILFLVFGTTYASKFGTKKGYVATVWVCIVTHVLLFLLLWLGDPTQIRLNNMGFMTIAFLILFVGCSSIRLTSSALSFPMLPDIIDYETYRSGRFVPGIIGAIGSFIDKCVSSLSHTIVGLMLAFIGFKAAFPDVDTPYSESIFWVTMILSYGGLIIGWIASLIAMRFYELDKERMIEIQEELESRRQENITNQPLLVNE